MADGACDWGGGGGGGEQNHCLADYRVSAGMHLTAQPSSIKSCVRQVNIQIVRTKFNVYQKVKKQTKQKTCMILFSFSFFNPLPTVFLALLSCGFTITATIKFMAPPLALLDVWVFSFKSQPFAIPLGPTVTAVTDIHVESNTLMS